MNTMFLKGIEELEKAILAFRNIKFASFLARKRHLVPFRIIIRRAPTFPAFINIVLVSFLTRKLVNPIFLKGRKLGTKRGGELQQWLEERSSDHEDLSFFSLAEHRSSFPHMEGRCLLPFGSQLFHSICLITCLIT